MLHLSEQVNYLLGIFEQLFLRVGHARGHRLEQIGGEQSAAYLMLQFISTTHNETTSMHSRRSKR